MKYHIDKVSSYPLHIDSSCNRDFGEDIKKFLNDKILGISKHTLWCVSQHVSVQLVRPNILMHFDTQNTAGKT